MGTAGEPLKVPEKPYRRAPSSTRATSFSLSAPPFSSERMMMSSNWVRSTSRGGVVTE